VRSSGSFSGIINSLASREILDFYGQKQLASSKPPLLGLSLMVSGPFSIALCCNGTMLPGLHATLRSLVKNLSKRDQVILTIFFEDINDHELEALNGTIAGAGGVGTSHFQKADTDAFKDLKAMHGQWMAYLRLLLPDLLRDAPTILYLDSDLIINIDACAFFEYQLENFPIAAIDGGTIEWCLDYKFLRSVGLTDQDRSFNSGILLFNARLWREDRLIARSLEMARTHKEALTSHDQSVLNALFSRNFYKLPPQFNVQLSPTHKALPEMESIYHFVGSPKPWDLLGAYSHRNWKLWHAVIKQTRFRWGDFLTRHGGAYVKRAWSLRRSYVRTWLRRRRQISSQLRRQILSLLPVRR